MKSIRPQKIDATRRELGPGVEPPAGAGEILLLGLGSTVGIVSHACCFLLLLAGFTGELSGRILNPVTDVCWHCIFPIKIGPVPLGGSGPTCTSPAIGSESPVCTCPIPVPPYIRVGASIGLWEPARISETVQNAWSFPSIGVVPRAPNMADKDGQNAGSQGGQGHKAFHVHYYYFPVNAVLGGLIQAACLSSDGFDIGYLTEIDPLWNNDSLAAIVNPEAILFANPAAQLSCSVDAVQSAMYCSNDALSWCMGSSGSAYPLTGNMESSNFFTASMGAAARLVYKMGRQGLLMDPGVNVCTPTPTPIWIKSNYRMQVAMPTRDVTCHPIGRTSLLWEYGKTVPGVADGYVVWIIWRKRACCAF